MFNTMNTIRPNPYPQRGNGNYNAGNESTDKDGHNSQGQERQQNQQQNRQVVARGRASDMVQTAPRAEIPYYAPAKRAFPQGQPVQQQGAQNAQAGQVRPQNLQYNQVNPQQYQALQAQSGYQTIPQQAPSNNQALSPLNAKSNKVNIAQILRDFRNTMKAIATPAEIEENVNRYLQIVEQHVKKPNAPVNLVQSNLKIAASLLDKYISETLNKESKVVQNWLDALFLQRINYDYNEQELNPNFAVQFDNNRQQNQTQNVENQINNSQETSSQKAKAPEISQQNIVEEKVEAPKYEEIEVAPQSLEEEFISAKQKISKRPNITIIPQDTRLRSLFVEAKKQAFMNNPQKAMSIFKEAFNRAGELKDSETQSRICLEIGKIYDDNDFVVQALNSYNKSLQYTTDTSVKSRAHFSMAQIYDDVNQVEPALEHYITSVSYAGNTDDLIGQSDSLTKIANIFTDKYNEYAFEYYDIAKKLIEQTDDNNMKGYVLSNTADACVQFRKKDKALRYYAEAVKNYEKSNSPEEIAENYKSAAELMIEFNSPNKARTLLKKSLVNAVKTKNEDLISEINMLLASVCE